MNVSQPDPVQALRSARAFFNNGEFFRSYDLAKESMHLFPGEVAFPHLAVLSLANAGAIDLALEKFTLFGLDQTDNPDARSLRARLHKDFGFAGPPSGRCLHHEQARALYLDLYRSASLRDSYYPGINAAALSLWCGDAAQAQELAAEVLAILEALEQAAPEDDLYWRRATQAEAYLILGHGDILESLLPILRQLGATQAAQIATTERQLRRIAQALNLSPHFLHTLALPAVMHFSGHIIHGPDRPSRFPANEEADVRQRIDHLLATRKIGSGYGSLAAGADILFAEALLARGAALHLVFPFALPDFILYSVAPSGESWVARFDTCLAAASSVHFATEDSYLHHEALFQYCSQLAMGLAVLAARHMQSPVMQCVVWDGIASAGTAGTVVDMAFWQATHNPLHIVRCGPREATDDLSQFTPTPPGPLAKGRQIRAMLFGDLHGFSRLTDRELPLFAEHIMGPVGQVVDTFRPRMSFINTWGDGIFAVFQDVRDAASFAVAVQQKMSGIDLVAAGLPPGLRLRLGGHLGPVYELNDPVLQRLNFYGAHVSRAARIEPVTPEGCIYVTETFAAVLTLEDSTHFACDYAGYTEMAKHYGQLRIFLLRPVSIDTGPAVLSDIERPPLP